MAHDRVSARREASVRPQAGDEGGFTHAHLTEAMT
jgi:hypothetical protein